MRDKLDILSRITEHQCRYWACAEHRGSFSAVGNVHRNFKRGNTSVYNIWEQSWVTLLKNIHIQILQIFISIYHVLLVSMQCNLRVSSIHLWNSTDEFFSNQNFQDTSIRKRMYEIIAYFTEIAYRTLYIPYMYMLSIQDLRQFTMITILSFSKTWWNIAATYGPELWKRTGLHLLDLHVENRAKNLSGQSLANELFFCWMLNETYK